MTRRVAAVLIASLIACGAVSRAAVDEKVGGYGPWRFGMTPAEVAQVKDLGPYTPVQATGGLETANGRFLGEKTNVSFIFGPRGLRRVQIWAYEGSDLAAAVRAFYSIYKYLGEQFGVLQQNDAACPPGLTLEAFQQHIPASYRDTSQVVTIDQLKTQGSMRPQMEKVQLRPQRSPAEASVFSSFIRSPQLGTFWVFLYYDAPSPSE